MSLEKDFSDFEGAITRVSREYDAFLYGSGGEPMGPHPVPQFQFIFTTAQFENIVPWLMLNRQGLDVLVHPLTDNSYDDHSRYAVWLGMPVRLKLNPASRGYRAEQYPAAH